MTPDDLRKDIGFVVSRLAETELLSDSNLLIRESIGAQRVRLSWARSGDRPAVHLEHASLAEYLAILSYRDYILRLTDDSIVQVSFEFERKRLIKHRYAYIPCPVFVPEEDEDFVIQHGLEEYLSLLSIDALSEGLRLGGAFRFDFDERAGKLGHPASHLTLFGNAPGLRNCRVPVFAPLSPGHFFTFLFQHFYGDWGRDLLEVFDLRWLRRTLDVAEQRELHVEWRRSS